MWSPRRDMLLEGDIFFTNDMGDTKLIDEKRSGLIPDK